MGKVYACSDLHGMIELYNKIKDFLAPEDKVYFLGDAGDRGTDCWTTMKKILTDQQFTCIMGNHEDMLLTVMRGYIEYGRTDIQDLMILAQNGGIPTYEGWEQEPESIKYEWYRKIFNLPDHIEYNNKSGKKIVMSHAGFTPKIDTPSWYGLHQDLIWDRCHITDSWPHDAPEDLIIIHGHTPIEYLVDELQWKDRSIQQPELPKAYWYSNGHKCCIDCGCFFTDCIVLLDLDTFEEHYFYTKDYDPEAKWD